ncbi:hypothetical protein J1N51_03105 [Psychrosphaera ytuae]|uniref:Uncharacterized protein n=1 Tax=Psychrosphaera ytuae TaxID=2820710 RepID=A0A975DDR1_9GAMM|nr:hypothetical protein [Psychrosphaera ytuae]QTH64481.1 hypothetical protein J1N51_03105 [Psychrosphaera ytuae]
MFSHLLADDKLKPLAFFWYCSDISPKIEFVSLKPYEHLPREYELAEQQWKVARRLQESAYVSNRIKG